MTDERTLAWVKAHAEAVSCGLETYRDPATGYLVFTAPTLRARGSCCGNGCRHCPYVDAERSGKDGQPHGS